jgi:TolB protein
MMPGPPAARMPKPVPPRSCLRLLAVLLSGAAWALPAVGSPGVFQDQGDVGPVSRPVAVSYDSTTRTYTIGAGGADIWGAKDAFGYVWKKVEGDLAITADISLVGASIQGHRKGCLMFRQSLEPGSRFADVAVHGDGHIALQFRSEPGGPTRTIQCAVSAPRRVRLEKRGAYVTLFVAGADGSLAPSGCVIGLTLEGSYFAGLAVSAHNGAGFETATFAGVELGTPKPAAATRTSALEVLSVSSLDRRVVYTSAGRMEAPHFSPEGTVLYFNRDGRIYRMGLGSTEAPALVDTGSATHCSDDHGISPDGTQLAISDYTDGGPSLMYLLPIQGGAPRRVDVPGPAYWHSWSPDGQTLAYCAARNGNYDIYTIPVSGGSETRLTTAPGNDNGPDYTADGQWIYFHSERTGRVQVWRMHADGSGQEQVTHDEYYNWFPHPSPDGRWIVFLSTLKTPTTGHPPDGDYVLRLIPSAGGVPREVARFYGGNGCFNIPCWSRDSTRIAYATFEPAP